MPTRSSSGRTCWLNACAANPTLRNVASETQDGGLRAFIDVDREKAGRLGISMQIINDTLNDAFGQRQISTIYGQANQYRVILEAAPQYQRDPSALEKLYVPANSPNQPLATSQRADVRPVTTSVDGAAASAARAFAEMTRTTAPLVDRAPGAISRRRRLSFDLAPGASLGDAVAIAIGGRARHRHAGAR